MTDARPRLIGGRQKHRIAYTQPAIGGLSTAVRRQCGLSDHRMGEALSGASLSFYPRGEGRLSVLIEINSGFFR